MRVLIVTALLLGFYISVPDFFESPSWMLS